jgi:hypothetical protein
MAKPLQTSTISAPGFLGINTQESSVDLSSGYALEAFNCVIDKFGRIGARRGWQKQNSSLNTDLDTNDIEFLFELPETATVLAGGNNKLFSFASGTITTESVYDNAGTSTISYTISGNDWSASSIVYGEGPDISPHAYLAQGGHAPLVFHKLGSGHAHTGAYGFQVLDDGTNAVGSVPTPYDGNETQFQPNFVLGAYGRTWWADIAGDTQTVYFSALLDGSNLSTGDSGYLSLVDVFPNGDEVVGLAAHNGFLIIFGKRNIAVYANPIDVTRLELVDLIANVGCIARDSIVNTGTDVMFLSDTGVRSIARVVQEKSAPINDISFNVRDDLVGFVASEANKEKIKAAYYPRDAFYLLTLPSSNYVYCFDLRGRLQNGAARATIWDSLKPKSLHITFAGDLLIGKEGYIGKYFGFLDNTEIYRLRYYTNYFDLGNPTSLKFLKKGTFVVIGGVGQDVALKYGFDYVDSFRSITKTLASGATVSEYNIAEYNIAEYTSGLKLEEVKANLGGSGSILQLGFEADINQNPLSIQKIDVYIKSGKVV